MLLLEIRFREVGLWNLQVGYFDCKKDKKEVIMSSPIRVLCVFSTLDRGGAESMCMNLYRHIDRKKIQFDFVKHTSKIGAFEEEIIGLGGHIYEAPRYRIYNHLHYIVWWNKFLNLHPEYKIIHGHYFTISSIYFKVAKKNGRVTIAHSHGTRAPKEAYDNRIKRIILDYLVRQIIFYSDYAFACSKDAGEWVFGDNPFIVLHNAIEVDRFKSNKAVGEVVRGELGLSNCFVVGNVSRFNVQKNPYATLEIFRQIHQKRPSSKLLWVGDGPMKSDMEEVVNKLGLKEYVLFTGVRDDVDRLLQAMDAFVFPSFYEGLGIAAIEAQAAGVETFCSNTIPQEVAITKLCHFLSLSDLKLWVEGILEIPTGYVHEDTADYIIKSGYQISENAKWLQEFYLSLR